MDLLLSFVNAALCAVISLALVWAILHPDVKDGIVIKFGLILMTFGFLGITFQLLDGVGEPRGLESALLLVNAGIAVVILGYLRKRQLAGTPMRRVSDHVSALSSKDLEQVSGGRK